MENSADFDISNLAQRTFIQMRVYYYFAVAALVGLLVFSATLIATNRNEISIWIIGSDQSLRAAALVALLFVIILAVFLCFLLIDKGRGPVSLTIDREAVAFTYSDGKKFLFKWNDTKLLLKAMTRQDTGDVYVSIPLRWATATISKEHLSRILDEAFKRNVPVSRREIPPSFKGPGVQRVDVGKPSKMQPVRELLLGW
jgi:hypothetical protein